MEPSQDSEPATCKLQVWCPANSTIVSPCFTYMLCKCMTHVNIDSAVCLPLPSARQHLSYGDCLEVKREYYQNSSVLDCVTQCSQSAATYMSSSCRSNRLGLSHWDPYVVRRSGCLELYYCNMVEWFWWDSSLISTTNFSVLTLFVWSSGL